MNDDHLPAPNTVASTRFRGRARALQSGVRTVNPWVVAGAAAAFLLLPRRFRRPLLKAAMPLALGLLKLR